VSKQATWTAPGNAARAALMPARLCGWWSGANGTRRSSSAMTAALNSSSATVSPIAVRIVMWAW